LIIKYHFINYSEEKKEELHFDINYKDAPDYKDIPRAREEGVLAIYPTEILY